MQIDLQKLKQIEGQELKYKQLCTALNIPVKTSNSKTAQLNNLQMYCELITLECPKRYKIIRVYDEELKMLRLLNEKNKFQLMFEAAVYQAFLNNGGQPLYLSNMDAIRLFKEVNDNFKYACKPELMKKLGPEYEYMPEVGKTIYKILSQWTLRKINNMDTRHTALKSTGYRLYYKKVYNGQIYVNYINVPQNSELSQQCQAIYNKAIEEIMPEGWGQNKEEEEKKKSGKYWVPDYIWLRFEKRIKELVQEEFNDKYDNLKAIIILNPPTSKYVKEKLEIMCRELQSITHINEEACQKALTTTQLDHISTKNRKKFIETNMNLATKFSFREKLKK